MCCEFRRHSTSSRSWAFLPRWIGRAPNMWSISPQVRVFLAREPVDMRKSFHGLVSLTESVLKKDPLSGQLFVFINRRRDRIKLLYWGGVGFCLWYQQLQ